MLRKVSLQVRQLERDWGGVTTPGFEFVLKDPRGEMRAESSFRPSDWDATTQALSELARCLNDLWGEPRSCEDQWRQAIEALDGLIPISTQDHMTQLDGYLELHCDHPTAVPWELSNSLAHHDFITRVPSKPVTILSHVQGDGNSKVMVGSNANMLSEWSKPEASAVSETLGRDFKVYARQGAELSKKQVLRALSEGYFSLIHLIAFINEHGLILNDGTVDHKELLRLDGVTRPRLVVIHAVTEGSGSLISHADALAKSFLASGVPAVLITGWNPDPDSATELFRTFYGANRELPSWQALEAAKEKARSSDDGQRSELSCLAYGNYEFTWKELSPVKIETVQNAPTSQGAWQADYQFVIIEGPDTGSVLPLFAAALNNGRKITIGRSGALPVDLSLDDETLDNVTASLEKSEQSLLLSNLTASPEKVRVNGLPVTQSVVLQGCDEIHLGATSLRIEPSATDGPEQPRALPKNDRFLLTVVDGVEEDRGNRVLLASRVTLVGRMNDCKLMLHDPSVSRQHLTLIPKNSGFYASGIGESLVVVNGFPLKNEHRLKHGDTLQLSPNTVLMFQDGQR